MNCDLLSRYRRPALLSSALLFAAFALPAIGFGQTGNGFFDFEGSNQAAVPPKGDRGQRPFGPDRYILETVAGGITPGLLIQTAQDGAPAAGNNGPFDDPMGGPGNKSAVWDNNNHFLGAGADGPTNATMGFGASVWTADATQWTNGTIEYDIWLDPAPAQGRTYMEHRVGFVNNDAFVNTVNDDTVGYNILDTGAGPQIVYSALGNLAGTPDPVAGALNHIIVTILPNHTHTISVNGTVVEWTTGGGPVTALPWATGAATGVSEMTFVTDFQGEPGDPHGLVWIDNVRITKVPELSAGALALIGLTSLMGWRRRTT